MNINKDIFFSLASSSPDLAPSKRPIEVEVNKLFPDSPQISVQIDLKQVQYPMEIDRLHQRIENIHFTSQGSVKILSAEKIYEETVRRLENAQEITAKVDEILTNKKKKVEDFVESIHVIPWKYTEINTKETPYLALAALKSGQISNLEFGTVLMFLMEIRLGAQLQGTITFEPLIVNGELNRALNLDHERWGLAPEQKENLIKKIQELPLSEQQIVKHRKKGINFEERDSFYTYLSHSELFNPLNLGWDINQRAFFSLGFFNCLSEVKYSQPVKVNPVLGLSSQEDLKNIEQRDIGLDFIGGETPIVSDDQLPCIGADFPWHDLYHASKASSNSRKIRKFNSVFVERLGKINAIYQSPSIKKILTRLIDVEFFTGKSSVDEPFNEEEIYLSILLNFTKKYVSDDSQKEAVINLIKSVYHDKDLQEQLQLNFVNEFAEIQEYALMI